MTQQLTYTEAVDLLGKENVIHMEARCLDEILKVGFNDGFCTKVVEIVALRDGNTLLFGADAKLVRGGIDFGITKIIISDEKLPDEMLDAYNDLKKEIEEAAATKLQKSNAATGNFVADK